MDIEQKLIEGLNRICDEGGDEYTALCKLLSRRAKVNGKDYYFMDIVNSALGANIRPETPGGGDNALLGFA
jgi:hypothetical protein